MHFPTWVDLKGQDSVPETVHHAVSCSLIFVFEIHNVMVYCVAPLTGSNDNTSCYSVIL